MLLTRSYSNYWEHGDRRFEGLLGIANAIQDAFDVAHGEEDIALESELEPDSYPMWAPTRLVQRMREAAERIEALTEV